MLLRSPIFLAAFLLAVMPAARADDVCKLAPLGSARVAAVRDGRTLRLADGRELRLAAIEVVDTSWAALTRLVEGQTLRLAGLGAMQDRYGRLVAFAFAGGSPDSVQLKLVELGQARVAARVGDKGCAERLLAAERAARAAKRGLWGVPNFALLRSDNLAGIGSEIGRFALVEGQVLSVRASGATIYLNFGRRWTRDFSVIILRRNQRKFAAAGLAPASLEGHRIRVRGIVERRRGPMIEVDAPEQIELLGGEQNE